MVFNLFILLNAAYKDSSASSEEETSASVTQSGRFPQKLKGMDDDNNSNQFSADTVTLSVLLAKDVIPRA